MNLFSVQNDLGEVYGGLQALPDAGIEIYEWRDKIESELGSIVGSNGVRVRPIRLDGLDQQRVVIDIKPGKDIEARLARVNDAIASIAIAGSN